MGKYEPSPEILEKYADVLINFALNDCTGVKKGQTVFLQVHESGKPMLVALRKAVLKKTMACGRFIIFTTRYTIVAF